MVLAGIFGLCCAIFGRRTSIRDIFRDDNYGVMVADPVMRRPPDNPQSEMSQRTNNPNAQLNEIEVMIITLKNTRAFELSREHGNQTKYQLC